MLVRHHLTAFTFVFAAVACSDGAGVAANDLPSPSPAPSSPAPDGGASPEGGETKEDATSDVTVEEIAAFDPAKYELPEALSYKDGFAYVSLAPKGQILKVDAKTGKQQLFASLPTRASNFTLGSTFDPDGNLFVGVGSTDPTDTEGVAAAGIYRVHDNGDGTAAVGLWASHSKNMKFGNGLAFAADGTLFVTDAAEGAVYAIPKTGALGSATVWKQDALLTGDQSACPGFVAAFPIGANGIVVDDDAVWVGNTDRGSLVRIAREPGGAAGAIIEVLADCAKLEGLDGLRPDPRNPKGALIGTNNPKNTLVRISRSGTISVLYESATAFDGPADIVHVTGTSSPAELLVVNSAFPTAFAPDAGVTPRPSLVKVTLPWE